MNCFINNYFNNCAYSKFGTFIIPYLYPLSISCINYNIHSNGSSFLASGTKSKSFILIGKYLNTTMESLLLVDPTFLNYPI